MKSRYLIKKNYLQKLGSLTILLKYIHNLYKKTYNFLTQIGILKSTILLVLAWPILHIFAYLLITYESSDSSGTSKSSDSKDSRDNSGSSDIVTLCHNNILSLLHLAITTYIHIHWRNTRWVREQPISEKISLH